MRTTDTTSTQRNTFLTVAFGGQIWNIQYARPVVNRKVKAFHHTALNECGVTPNATVRNVFPCSVLSSPMLRASW